MRYCFRNTLRRKAGDTPRMTPAFWKHDRTFKLSDLYSLQDQLYEKWRSTALWETRRWAGRGWPHQVHYQVEGCCHRLISPRGCGNQSSWGPGENEPSLMGAKFLQPNAGGFGIAFKPTTAVDAQGLPGLLVNPVRWMWESLLGIWC